jgi:cytoskeleton protein RodZ
VGQFGDKFRKEREKKGISLDEVSSATKIGSRMLLAIEQEHFDQLPGGVFNKGFIRAYAKHLGLNDDEAVAQYLACLRQAQIDEQAAWQPPSRADVPAKRPPSSGRKQPGRKGSSSQAASSPTSTQGDELPGLQLPRAEHVRPRREYLRGGESGIPWGIVAAAAVILVLSAVLWYRHGRNGRTQAAMNPTAANSLSASPPAPNSTSESLPAPPAAAKASARNAHPSSGARPALSPVSASRRAQTAETDSASPNTNTETAGSSAQANSAPVASTAPALTLVIRAAENSWISVTADGQVVSRETLIAPADTSVHASREVVVKVGNAAGVSFLFNGKEVPPQGSEAEVKTLVFDSSGLRTTQAPAAPATVN